MADSRKSFIASIRRQSWKFITMRWFRWSRSIASGVASCGVLSQDEEEVYCPACVPKMAEFPPPMRKPRVVVVAVNSVDEIEACLAELTGISVQGGNA
jgi:hypothetical protein